MTVSYEPRWDLDRVYGEDGETLVAHLLGLDGASVEVKRKRYEDFKFYVEAGQSPLANGAYKPSGINTSQADYWAYVIASTGVVVFVPRERLLAAARLAPEVAETHGDNPTKGRLVAAEHLFSHLRAAS